MAHAGSAGAVYNSPIPGTPAIGSAQDAAKLAYQNAQARIAQKRNNLLLNSGYKAEFGTGGQLQNLRVDPNNPFGGLQQMLRSQANEDQQAQFLGQERGLHGGLANQAVTNLNYEHGAQSADFGRNLTQGFGDISDEQRQSEYDYNNALYEAKHQAALEAIANQNFNPGMAPTGDTINWDDILGGNTTTTTTGTRTGASTDFQAGPSLWGMIHPPVVKAAPKPAPKPKPKPKPKTKVAWKIVSSRTGR